MKHEVDALEKAELDAAVAATLGLRWRFAVHGNGERVCEAGVLSSLRLFRPSSDWQHGGPLVEMHTIDLRWLGTAWTASCPCPKGPVEARGTEPLVAAMRAFVRTSHPHDIDLATVRWTTEPFPRRDHRCCPRLEPQRPSAVPANREGAGRAGEHDDERSR